MAEDAAMKIYQLETDLMQAKVMYFDRIRELDEKNKELEKFHRILEQQKNEINSLKKFNQKFLIDESSKESSELKQKNIELEEKNKEVANCKMLLLKLNDEIVNYQEEIAKLKRKNKELEQRHEGMEEFQKQIPKLRSEIEIIKEENIQLNRKNNEIARELDEKNKEIEELLLRLFNDLDKKHEELEKFKRMSQELERELNHLKEISNASRIELNIKNKELEQRHEGMEELQKQILKLKNEIEIIKKGNIQLNSEITRSRARSRAHSRAHSRARLQENNRQCPTGYPEKQKYVDANEIHSSVLILGGNWDLKIYLLDSSSQCWKELKITLPNQMLSFGTAVVNEEIYIFNGHSRKGCEKCCYKLKSDGEWMELASLNEKKAGISNSSVVYFEEIWVIGGYSGKRFLRSVEKYNISQNRWIRMPELNESRSFAAAAVFKNKIIVTGGFNNYYLKSVEIFDANLQRWMIFCSLPRALKSHCMRITDSILTIYGGCSAESTFNNIWEMDINDPEKKWTKKKDFKYKRRCFGIAKYSNATAVFGGDVDNNDPLDSTEIFDGNNWTEGPKLPTALSYFAYTEIPRSVEESLLRNFS